FPNSRPGRLGEPWRRALQHLREYAVDGRSEELLRIVVGAINQLHHLGSLKEDAITRRQIDPAGFRSPARLALELDLGVDFEVRLARGPVLPDLSRPRTERRRGALGAAGTGRSPSTPSTAPAHLA